MTGVGFSLQLEPVLTLVNAVSSDASCPPALLRLHEGLGLCQICSFTLHLICMFMVDSNNQSVNDTGEAGRDVWRGATFLNDSVILVLLLLLLLLLEILDNPDSDNLGCELQ